MMVTWARTLAVESVSSGQILHTLSTRCMGSERKRGIQDGSKIFGASGRMKLLLLILETSSSLVVILSLRFLLDIQVEMQVGY